ncbi:MAG: hypothetical protein HC911_16380 [Chloroflexaceae bacterium]|nr:hypothetical protein [Chloroflexaceae bacterium]
MDETPIKAAILHALQACANSSPLRTSALQLVQELGYHSTRTLELAPNTAHGLQQTFGIALEPHRALTDAWQTVDVLLQLTDEEMRGAGVQSLLPFDSSRQVDNARIESYLFLRSGCGARATPAPSLPRLPAR